MKNNIHIRKESAYETPSASIIDIQAEGVLCGSGIDIDNWKHDDEILDFE